MKYEIMLGILFELLSKKSVSATYLSDKYGVSTRSIYRYINCIEMAGVPIYTNRGNNGGFSIVDTYKLNSTFLSEKEFNQVINALNAFNNEVPNKALSNAILKLKATFKTSYKNINLQSGNLIIDGAPWGDTGCKEKLLVIQNCIENNQQLSIKYHDRTGKVTDRIIYPHILIFKQGLWYVYAFCTLRKTFRFFKIGRIEYANILQETFIRQEIKTSDIPLNFWENSSDSCDTVLEIKNNILSDVQDWLGIENIHKENDKNIARIKLPFDDGLVAKIMSFSGGIKVLEPPELKEKIIEKSRNLLNDYK